MLLLPFLSIVTSTQTPEVVHLWQNGVPGFESRKDEPELAKDWWVKNIHNPSITVFLPPKEIATGAAVLICPGGGHSQLVFGAEGTDAAKYLNTLGVAAFALKYRLAREENSPYKLTECVPQDAYRAMRLIRSRATEWGIDPKRLGMLGFSAGGEVVNAIAYGKGDGDANAPDAIDRLNGKPNFIMEVYPGPLWIPAEIPADAPPAFLVVANDDGLATTLIDLLKKYHTAKVPVEAHIFAQGNHAFNMGYRSNLASIKGWPLRMADWLKDNGWQKK